MNLLQQERDTYSEMWQSVPTYSEITVNSPTVKLFMDMSGATSGHILDAGCGTGKGGLLLAEKGFTVTLLDFTPEGLIEEAKSLPFRNVCLWDDLGSNNVLYDYTFCTDVLEHIPTEYTMLVAHRLLEASKEGVFFTIALTPDNCGVWMGKALHHTVKEFTWWRDRLKTLGHVVECRDLLIKGAYYVSK